MTWNNLFLWIPEELISAINQDIDDAKVNLEEASQIALKDDEFRKKNPTGKVPTVEFEDGQCLSESNAILTYFAPQVAEADFRHCAAA